MTLGGKTKKAIGTALIVILFSGAAAAVSIAAAEGTAHAATPTVAPAAVVSPSIDCFAGIAFWGGGIVASILAPEAGIAIKIFGASSLTWDAITTAKSCQDVLKQKYPPLMRCTRSYLTTSYTQNWIFMVASRVYKEPCGVYLPPIISILSTGEPVAQGVMP